MSAIIITTLLDSTQTFIGVIITLIVLCLYENKDNNYLRKIAGDFSLDILGDMKTKLRIIQDAINDTTTKLPNCNSKSPQDDVMDNFDYWFKVATDEEKQKLSKNRGEMDNVKAVLSTNIAQKEQDYKKRQKEFEKRKEDRLMALYILVVAMSIMEIDCILPFSKYASFSLLSLSIIVLFYSIAIWMRFYKGLDLIVETKMPSHSLLKGLRRFLFDLFPFILLLYLIYKRVIMYEFVWPIYILMLVLICIIHLKWGALSYVSSENFNNRLIAFHALYHLCLSFSYGLILWFSQLIFSKKGYFGVAFSENIAPLVNVETISTKVFVLIIGLNAFFIPILLCFIYYRKTAKAIVNEIGIEYDKSIKKIKKLKEEYTRIVQDIQQKAINQ